MYIKQTPISARNKQSVDSSKKFIRSRISQMEPSNYLNKSYLMKLVVESHVYPCKYCLYVYLQVLTREEDMETLVVDTSTRPDLVLHNNRKKKG